ncbi:MAG: DinB family protein [bacterium]
MSEIFLDLYKHHLWANLSLLDACEQLPDEGLDAGATGTYGAIGDTLVHILAAEGRYLAGMTGREAAPDALKEGTFPGIAELKGRSRASGEELIALAGSVTSNDVIRVERGGQRYEIPISIFFAQAINHGTEHRAHVCTALTQSGIEPPNLDVWQYLRSRAASR